MKQGERPEYIYDFQEVNYKNQKIVENVCVTIFHSLKKINFIVFFSNFLLFFFWIFSNNLRCQEFKFEAKFREYEKSHRANTHGILLIVGDGKSDDKPNERKIVAQDLQKVCLLV